MNPPPLSTKRTLRRIAPLSAGKLLALFYGVMGLILIPFYLLMVVFAAHLPAPQRGIFAVVGMGFAICLPIFYAVFGFIGGVLGAAIYNLTQLIWQKAHCYSPFDHVSLTQFSLARRPLS